jgi:hypothetical protein
VEVSMKQHTRQCRMRHGTCSRAGTAPDRKHTKSSSVCGSCVQVQCVCVCPRMCVFFGGGGRSDQFSTAVTE